MKPRSKSFITSSGKSLFAWLNLPAALFGILLLLLTGCVSNAQPGEYRLGHEDVIIVTVMGHEELSGEFFIPSDGLIDIPRVGQLPVTGKTLAEVSEMVTEGVRKFLLKPDVSIKLRTPRPQPVYVMGAVTRPGPYDLKPGWRIAEAVGAAGGIMAGVENSDCTVILLRGASGTKQSIPLVDVVRGEKNNLPLMPGDLVTVEVLQTIPVYVMGKVNHPGLYNIRSDNTDLLAAITMAGGTLEDAALTKITVTHLSGETETVSIVPVTIEGKQQAQLKLKAGDLVVVPESLSKFAVLGWVNAPGFFPLQENKQISLSEAIGMARGVDNKRGGLTKVAIIHTSPDGKEERKIYDLNKFLKDGDASQNPAVKSGDVVFIPETNKPDWDRVFSAIAATCSLLWTATRL